MSLGAIIIEGAQYPCSLITARLAMEFGREVFGVPGNERQVVSFAPNLLNCAAPEAERRNLLVARVVSRLQAEDLRAAQFRRFPPD
jgi:predicted Rossmann fold nucleotide-binding protein DprA/Smf involved in DNA uptake